MWPTHKIRTFNEHVDPGGGGVNVARVIHALGGETLALVLAGGVTGDFLNELLNEAGVPHQCLPIAGRTRVSTTVHDQATGAEYRFVPEGPLVAAAEWQAMLDLLEQIEAGGSSPAAACRVASRKISMPGPRTLPRDVASALCWTVPAPPLRAALGHGIALLKPSLNELQQLLGRMLADPRAQEDEAVALVRRGAAGMVALTLGAEGALLATAAGVIPAGGGSPGPVRSTVGAGDAFLAAITLALARGRTPADALAWGIAAGCRGSVRRRNRAHHPRAGRSTGSRQASGEQQHPGAP